MAKSVAISATCQMEVSPSNFDDDKKKAIAIVKSK